MKKLPVEVVDDRKVQQMEKWFSSIGIETTARLWEKAKEGTLDFRKVWKTAFPATRCSPSQARLAAKFGLNRYIAKNRNIISQLLEGRGLGIEKILDKTKELIDAEQVQTYRGNIITDPKTGGNLSLPDRPTQTKALNILLEMHDLKQENKGPQVLIYINAPQISKPENAGVGAQISAGKGKQRNKA